MFKGHGESCQDRKIGWFVIPTKNRPNHLERALKSYLSNIKSYNHNIKVLIADDSDDDLCISYNKKALESFSNKFNVEIYYSGSSEKRQLVEHFLEKFREYHAEINFCLYGYPGETLSFGANRNLILLQTAGSLVYCADDDTECYPGRIRNFSADAETCFKNDKIQHWFFSTRKMALEAINFENVDLLGAHESIYQRFSGNKCHQDVSNNTDSILANDYQNGPSNSDHILIVNNGIVGDSGYHSSFGLLSLDCEASMQRLLKSESGYRSALKNRNVVRQSPSLTLSSPSRFMSTSYSFENYGKLPPFFPNGRNEDGVFAFFIKIFSTGNYLADLPLTLIHSPCESRTYSHEILPIRISDVLISFLHQFSMKELITTEKLSLEDIGQYLMDFSSMDFPEQKKVLHEAISNSLLGKLEKLCGLLIQKTGKPKYWADDVMRQIVFIERAITCDKFSLPTDVHTEQDSVETIKKISECFLLFGRLLKIWPILMSETKTLNLKDYSNYKLRIK